jgi:hypothetical protein
MSKFFIIDPKRHELSKNDIADIENKRIEISASSWKSREQNAKEAVEKSCTLKFVSGRIIIKSNLELKNTTKFEDGTVIRLERKFNEFNRRITQPVQGVVISAENIPDGCEIMVNHNAFHDSNRIFDYESGSSDVQYFSIPEEECYAWRDANGELRPMKDFAFGLRVFKPYTGMIEGIEPEQIKDVLYITTGNLKGKIVHTLKAADYEIVFQGLSGKEENVIRVRHSEERKYFDREEIIIIRNDLTELLYDGKLMVGLTKTNCKKIN